MARSGYLQGFPEVSIRVPGCEIDPATGKPFNLKADASGRPAVEGPHCGIVTRFR